MVQTGIGYGNHPCRPLFPVSSLLLSVDRTSYDAPIVASEQHQDFARLVLTEQRAGDASADQELCLFTAYA